MHVHVVRRTVPRVSVFRISFHIHLHFRQSPNTVLPANLKHMLCQTKRVDRVGTTAYKLSHDRDSKMRERYSRQPLAPAHHDLRQKVAGVTVTGRP